MSKILLPLFICLFWLTACTSNNEPENATAAPVTETDRSSATPATSSKPVHSEIPIRNFDQLLEKATPDGKPEGLLLGFRTPQSEYVTYYFLIEEGKLTKTLELPYLVTPQLDGFHFLQTFYTYSSSEENPEDYGWSPEEYPDGMEYQYADWSPRDFTSAADLTRALAKHQKENTKTVDEAEAWLYENARDEILYILPGLVTVEKSVEGYGGGVHGYYGYDRYTMPFLPGMPVPKRDQKVMDTLFQNQFSPATWAEIKRQLYIQGPRNESEYGGQEPYDIDYTTDEADRSDDQIGDYDPEYAVDTEELDFILEHKNGTVELRVLAYAPAPYVMEHTYQVTNFFQSQA